MAADWRLRLREVTDIKTFEYPMSRDARGLLDTCVSGMLRFNGPDNALLREFVGMYDPIIYEDAVLCWNVSSIQKSITTTKLTDDSKRLKPADALSIALLRPLYDKKWNIPLSKYAQFRFGQSDQASEIYRYVTTKYLLEDFTIFDLVKLSEIAKFPLEEVQNRCRTLQQAHQKSIPYLLKVLRNEEVVERDNTAQVKAATDRSEEVIAAAIAVQSMPTYRPPYDPGWLDDIKLTRLMQEEQDKE